MSTVLITGGSSGIGLELAKCYAADGADLILCARNEERLCRARDEIMLRYQVNAEVIAADLSKPGSAEQLYEQVKARSVDVLINNAGIGFAGKSWELSVEKEEEMVRLNTASLMSLCKLFLKDFIQRGSGTIINVASTGAFQAGPYIAGYYASKAFVLNYSKALYEEAKPYGIHICCVCPGPVDTDFYEKSGGKKPKLIMSAEKTAKTAYREIQKSRKVIVPGIVNRAALIFPEPVRVSFVKRSKLKNLKKK